MAKTIQQKRISSQRIRDYLNHPQEKILLDLLKDQQKLSKFCKFSANVLNNYFVDPTNVLIRSNNAGKNRIPLIDLLSGLFIESESKIYFERLQDLVISRNMTEKFEV